MYIYVYTCVYICVCVSFWISVFIFFEYVPRSGIIGSDGSSIFHFWGNPMLFSTVATPSYIPTNSVQFSSVAQSCPALWDPTDSRTWGFPVHHQLPYSNSCPFSWWCHPTISSSVVPFSSCLQSLPASGSVPMNQFFTSGSQSIGVSASASVLPMNIQDWFPLAWTSWISLQSRGLSRVFSNTTVWKHQFFSTQLSL